jgi:outer membrane protein assembly factor BamD (BamD/ComL family)
MCWGIVLGSGLYWECDPMARVDRNVQFSAGFNQTRPRRDAGSRQFAGPPAPEALMARARLAIVALLPLLFAGCTSFSGPITQWRQAYDGGLFRGVSKDEMADASGPADSQNLFDRWVTPRQAGGTPSDGSAPSTLILGSDGWRPIAKPAKDPKADADLEVAKKLFEQGNFAEAEKAFTKIAKDRKGLPWGETAQYYVAETRYQRGKYVDAHDSFEKLHADYPATDYLDKLVAREYAIAEIWALQDDPDAPKDRILPWYSRFDGRLPIIDTQGYALKALEHVRHNDPMGPLADDAALQIAEYYMKHRDYESAAMYYDQFIAEYTKSPYLQKVQHAAIDARMRGYLGPEYDASGLVKARELVQKTMKTFPEQQASYESLYHTLDVINNAEAEKTFLTGTYYKRVGRIPAAEFYLGKIPQRWPGSPWAVKAKVELAQLAKMPRTLSKPSKIMIPPGSTDPFGQGGQGMGGMGGGMGGMGGMGGGMGGMGGGQMSPEAVNRRLRSSIATTSAELAARETHPQSKAILKKLEMAISMPFSGDNTLEEVLKYIQQTTAANNDSGIPIYVDPKGLKEAEATLQSRINLDLQGVPLKTTFRLALKQIGLAYCVRDGVLIVSSAQGIHEELMEAVSELQGADAPAGGGLGGGGGFR